MKPKVTGLILILLLLAQQSVAQSKFDHLFTLKGRLNTTHVDTVFLYYQTNTGQNVFSSVPIFNDRFIIGDSIERPVRAFILFKNAGEVIPGTEMESRSKEIYLEPGLLTLTGDPAKLNELKLEGSATQDELDTLESSIMAVREAMKRTSGQFDLALKENDSTKIARTRALYEAYENEEKGLNYRFFFNHPNSYVTAARVLPYINTVGLDSSRRIYNNYNSVLKASPDGKRLADGINAIATGPGSPGSMAANFASTDVSDKPIALADLKGKYVLIDFWASWCGPCRKSSPHLMSLFNNYKSKGFDIIAVADDDSKPELWKAAIASDNTGIWHHVLRGFKAAGHPGDINKKYAIRTLPTKILIDPSGKIIGRFGDISGGTDEDLDKMLAAIFR